MEKSTIIYFKGVFRGRYRGLYGNHEYIMLCGESMFIDRINFYGDFDKFVALMKERWEKNIENCSFFGESILDNGGGRIDFNTKYSDDLPPRLLKICLKNVLKPSNRWFGTYYNCGIFYGNVFLGKIAEIVEKS